MILGQHCSIRPRNPIRAFDLTGAGAVHTDRVNLLELFRQQFPDYWRAHQQAPPIVRVSVEARSDRTQSLAVARLYALVFRGR
jgi:hypothetical protein